MIYTNTQKEEMYEKFMNENPSLKLENQNPYQHQGSIAKEKKSNKSDIEVLARAKNTRYSKRTYKLTEEQIEENEAYFNFVKYPPPKREMTVKDAKKFIWQMIKEDDEEKKREFLLDDYSKAALNDLCHYFLNDEKCELDLRKGIWIYGKLGSGKTYMANLFSRFTRKFKLPRCYWMNSMEGLRKKVKSEKSIDCLDKFQKGIHGFDDVGQEKEVSVYGDKENLFQNILESQYREWEDNGQIMIVTSNLIPANVAEILKKNGSKAIYDIDTKYDERTSDRINQMFNFVPLMGKNKRKL